MLWDKAVQHLECTSVQAMSSDSQHQVGWPTVLSIRSPRENRRFVLPFQLVFSVSLHHDQKQVGEERACVLFGLCFHIVIHYWRESRKELKEGWNLEAGADAKAMERWCLLTCSPWLAQPKDGTSHMGWAFPHQLIKKMPICLPAT